MSGIRLSCDTPRVELTGAIWELCAGGSMETRRRASWQMWGIGFIAFALGLFLLALGRFFLVPLAIAILLFSLMTAAIDRISRLRLGRFRVPEWAAALVTLVVMAGAALVVLGIVSTQVNALIVAGPRLVDQGQALVADVFLWVGKDAAAGILTALRQIDIAGYIQVLAGSAGYFLGTTILIILYVGFLFAERGHFSDKLNRLIADTQRARHVDLVIDSIASNVRRYVLIKTLVSCLTGFIVFFVTWMAGLDFAETWGVLAFFLNFIPNIGSMIATALPVLVAVVQFAHWSEVLGLFLLLGVIQFSVGNLLEPMLMGRSLHLSSFVIILSLTFWGAVWGIVGMFLAVPIMVTVMIVCSHVPPLHPVAVLLSRDGKLPPMEGRRVEKGQ